MAAQVESEKDARQAGPWDGQKKRCPRCDVLGSIGWDHWVGLPVEGIDHLLGGYPLYASWFSQWLIERNQAGQPEVGHGNRSCQATLDSIHEPRGLGGFQGAGRFTIDVDSM